jgi:proteasome beta subunit
MSPEPIPSTDRDASFSSLIESLGQSPFSSLQHLSSDSANWGAGPQLTHGTTIVALRYGAGVIMAGDRRATAGNVIAHRSMQKVFPADRHSGVSISGVAGVAAEMVKLFQLELEHYEKVEGVQLSLEGKATRLANMIRSNLPMAMQSGMVVIPIFAGYDLRRNMGRIFNYDITGGRYEEAEFHATGSGGTYARSLIKHRWREGLTREEGIDIAVAALFEAADEDSATGGPDLVRGFYPTVATITLDGYTDVPESEIAQRFAATVAGLSAGQASNVAITTAATTAAPAPSPTPTAKTKAVKS